jgi:hypothetical protein
LKSYHFFIAAVLIPLSSILAQGIMPGTNYQRGIHIELFKPVLNELSAPAIFSSGGFISGRYAIHPLISFEADAGLVYMGSDQSNSSALFLANPYAGVLLQTSQTLTLRVGARLPLAPDQGSKARAAALGMEVNSGKQDAFAPNVMPASLSIIGEHIYGNGIGYHVSLGPEFWLDTDPAEPQYRNQIQEPIDIFVKYRIIYLHRIQKFTSFGGFDGNLQMTEDFKEKVQRVNNDFVLGAHREVASFRPAVTLRFPADSRAFESTYLTGALHLITEF